MFDNYPIDAIADIVRSGSSLGLKRTQVANGFPGILGQDNLTIRLAKWQRAAVAAALPVMPEKVFAKYRQWQDVIRTRRIV